MVLLSSAALSWLSGWLYVYMTICRASHYTSARPFVTNDSMYFIFGTTIHMNMRSQRAITIVTSILQMAPNILVTFYIRGSVHRNSTLKNSNEMQLYADIYLLLNCSTCFGRPSSGVHKTVVAASGTDHTIWGASFFKRDQRCDLYHRLQLQFYALLMMGARNM